jgi:hypothetical protein
MILEGFTNVTEVETFRSCGSKSIREAAVVDVIAVDQRQNDSVHSDGCAL